MTAFPSRLERFAEVDSTQHVVRGWLGSGVPEVCVAVADAQSAGRGRQGRGWTAPPGAALLVSVGFRPSWLPVRHGWRLAAIASLAMLDAAEDVAGLRDGTLWLKWPNDLLRNRRKLGGILVELLPGAPHAAVIGIGINLHLPAAMPPDLRAASAALDLPATRPVRRVSYGLADHGHPTVAEALAPWLDRWVGGR